METFVVGEATGEYNESDPGGGPLWQAQTQETRVQDVGEEGPLFGVSQCGLRSMPPLFGSPIPVPRGYVFRVSLGVSVGRRGPIMARGVEQVQPRRCNVRGKACWMLVDLNFADSHSHDRGGVWAGFPAPSLIEQLPLAPLRKSLPILHASSTLQHSRSAPSHTPYLPRSCCVWVAGGQSGVWC